MKVLKLFSVAVVVASLVACGGGGGGGDAIDTGASTSNLCYQVEVGEVKQFSMTTSGNAIAGGACTYSSILDSNGNQYPAETFYERTLTPGTYTATFTGQYTYNIDGLAALYYPSSSCSIPILNFGESNFVGSRTTKLYKFTLIQTTTLLFGDTGLQVYLFDENLNAVVRGSSTPTLESGTYYVLATPTNCKTGAGEFVIAKL